MSQQPAAAQRGHSQQRQFVRTEAAETLSCLLRRRELVDSHHMLQQPEAPTAVVLMHSEAGR